MEYKVEIYHSVDFISDEYYLPFVAICSQEEMIKLMDFALERDYIALVSYVEEEEKQNE